MKKKTHETSHYAVLLKTAWKFCDVKRWRFFLIYTLFFIANSVNMIEPLIFAGMVNTLQTGGENMIMNLGLLLLSLIGIEILFWIFHGPARVIERQLAFDVVKNYRQKLFKGLGELPLKWHHDNHSGATISRSKKATESLMDFVGHQFMYIENFFQFVVIGFIFFLFVPKYAALAILASLFLFFVVIKFDKIYSKALKEYNEKEHFMDAGFIDFIGNAVTVVTLRVQKMAEKEYFKRILKLLKPYQRQIRMNEWKWFVVSVGVASIYFIALFPYAYENYVVGDTVLIGGFVALLEYTRRYTHIFYGFADKYERLVYGRTNIESLEPIWETIDSNQSLETKLDKKKWHRVDISNLYFKHELDTDSNDLHDVDLQLKKGLKIALIGESGSGKSTLMRVLRGLYLPDKITVSFDGKEDADAFKWLQNHTTLIPQDPEIFENTIYFNITLGVSISKAEFNEVIKLSKFDKVIERLPNKENTDIRERGVNLSGGEKQRLALARGLLAAKQSDIVLLDEPTSSVDIKNELQIFKSMFSKWKDKCFVASVHRIHLLDQFDLVYEMKNGKIKKHSQKK